LRYTEEEKDFLEKRSTENLIIMYREELLQIVGGEGYPRMLPKGVRRQLRRDGVLSMIGHRFEVTPKGKKMLAVIDDAEE